MDLIYQPYHGASADTGVRPTDAAVAPGGHHIDLRGNFVAFRIHDTDPGGIVEFALGKRQTPTIGPAGPG